MTGWDDNTRADGLFPKVILQDPLLNLLHNAAAKITNNCQIHPGVHQSKRIPGRNNTIECRQILESSTNDLNFEMRTKLPAKNVTKVFALIDQMNRITKT